MTPLLERLLGAFYVAPAHAEPRGRGDRWAGSGPSHAAAALPPAVAVLAQARDVAVAGGAVGLAAARECRAGVAVVCTWTGLDEPVHAVSAPATAAAHRLAEALRRRGHVVRASRRLVLVTLPGDEETAAREAARVAAAARVAPVVLALGGPRGAHLDEALRARDLVVVASRNGGDPGLAALAVAGIESSGVRAVACEVPAAPSARVLAAAGLGLSPGAWPGLRRALAAVR